MGAGHTVTALYEIVPAGSEENNTLVDPLKYQSVIPARAADGNEWLTIKVRYKETGKDTNKLVEIPVKEIRNLSSSSENFRFAAAVAEFGMLIRGSEYMAGSDINQVIELASQAKGTDPEGYRSEFIQLAKTIKDLRCFTDD